GRPGRARHHHPLPLHDLRRSTQDLPRLHPRLRALPDRPPPRRPVAVARRAPNNDAFAPRRCRSEGSGPSSLHDCWSFRQPDPRLRFVGLGEPFTRVEVRRLAPQLLDSEAIWFSGHARTEMVKDGLIEADAVHTIRQGVAHQATMQTDGTYSYK